MPKAPLRAQVIIGLFAVLAIAYGISIARLDQTSNGQIRTAVPGQLIVVRIDRTTDSMTSSDPWVLAPVSISLSPVTSAFFLAIKPGHATLRSSFRACAQCLSIEMFWSVDVTVWPG